MARKFCLVMGVIFLIIGMWGWIRGDRVLIFHVNPLHNAVHLASGVAALIFAFNTERAARGFCFVFGAVYGLVAILGLLNIEPVVEALHLNDADDWLHVVIAAAFIIVGVLSASAQKHARGLEPPPDTAAPPRPAPRPAP